MRLKEILDITEGSLINPTDINMKIKGFSIDSRKIENGEIFVALKGNNFDGHQFIEDAISKGALGYFTEKEIKLKNGIFVNNTLNALTEIGKHKRKWLKTTIGITGTAGKTTTKELLKFVLAKDFKTYATKGNYNNQIGLPLTLANIPDNTEIGIFELGANKIGDIKELIEISNPDIRVLTSVGYGHTEGFGSFEGVIKGKGEIFSESYKNVLPVNLKRFYNLERYITFGISDEADIQIKNVKITKNGTKGLIQYKNDKIILELPVYNKAIFSNIGAVAGVLFYLGLNPIKNLKILEDFRLPEGRGKVIKYKNLTIIDDTYNANPLSVENAIFSLNSIPTYKAIVLGDMLELGYFSESLHREIGRLIKKTDIDLVFLYGEDTKYIYNELKNVKKSFYSNNQKILIDLLLNELKSLEQPITILFKGSRGMKIENIMNELLKFY